MTLLTVCALTGAEQTATAAAGVNYAPTAAATVTGLTLSSIEYGGAGQGARPQRVSPPR